MVKLSVFTCIVPVKHIKAFGKWNCHHQYTKISTHIHLDSAFSLTALADKN